MKKKRYIILLLVLIVTGRLYSDEIRHSAGIEVSFFGYSSFIDDPYSLPAGLGLFYTIKKLSKSSLFFGTSLLWYGFVSSKTFYTGSVMIIPAVSLGYNFAFDLTHKSEFILSPYISYGHYFRSIEIDESTMWFNRPVITGGLDIVINTEIKTTSAIGFFVSVIMDNSLVLMPGLRVKTGYSWGSVK